MLQGWTIKRATGIGFVAGLAALLLWVAYPPYPDLLLWPFLIAAAVTAFCGISILWITAVDVFKHRRKGRHLLPIRLFDVAVGLLLAAPSLYGVRGLLHDGWGL